MATWPLVNALRIDGRTGWGAVNAKALPIETAITIATMILVLILEIVKAFERYMTLEECKSKVKTRYCQAPLDIVIQRVHYRDIHVL